MKTIKSTDQNEISRREFLRYAGLVGVSLASGGLLSTACGGAQKAPTATLASPSTLVPATQPPKQVTLNWWEPDTREDWLKARDQVTSDFRQAFPNINFEVTTVGWGDIEPKVVAAFAANTLPDMANSWGSIYGSWAYAGITQPVDDIIEAIGKDQFSSSLIVNATVNDHMVAVPIYTYPHILYYRRDLYEQKGLKAPTSWEELYENCKAVHNPPDVYGFLVYNDPATPELFFDLCGTNDAPLFDKDGNVVVDSPNVVEVLEFIKRLSDFAPPGSLQKADEEQRLIFAAGNGAHMITSTSLANVLLAEGTLFEQVDAVPVPLNKGSRGASADFIALCISSTTQLRSEVSEFIQFWCQPAEFLKFAQTTIVGHIPALKSVLDSEEYWNHPRIKPMERFVRTGAQASATGISGGLFYGPNPWMGRVFGAHITTQMLDRTLLGEDPTSVAAWAQKEVEAIKAGS